MPSLRHSGDIQLNGVPYNIAKDLKSGDYQYQRASTPKANASNAKMWATSTGKSGMIEASWPMVDGMGDSAMGKFQRYNYTIGTWNERPGEIVMLPSAIPLYNGGVAATASPGTAPAFPVHDAPVFVGDMGGITYTLQDRRLLQTRSSLTGTPIPIVINMKATQWEIFTFETTTKPTHGLVFNSTLYIATGGATTDRFLRTYSVADGMSKDDNSSKSITATQDNGAGHPQFTSASHGYSNGQKVLIQGYLAATGYNGIFAIANVTVNTFDILTLTTVTHAGTASALNPVASWPMNEAAGPSIADAGGLNNIATAVAAPTFHAAGPLLPADFGITFDGTTQYATVADSNSINLGDNFTIYCWYKRAATTAIQTIIDRGTNAYMLRINANDYVELVKQGATPLVIATSSLKINDITTFHQIVVTKNGTDVHIYIDKVDVTGVVNNQTCSNPPTTSDTGTSTAVGATTLTDTTKAWIVNQWAGHTATVGANVLTITSNTATVLTGTWSGSAQPPQAANAYSISVNAPPMNIGRNTLTATNFINGTLTELNLYNSALSLATVVALYQFKTAESGITMNRQDSDVHAEFLTVVGDLMVRIYQDPVLGWSSSRVDPISSDPMLSANWTAGIGTLSVGDPNEKPTALVAMENGELICTPRGAFSYRSDKGGYLNAIPELEKHPHPDNGKGSFYWKGWVYIPTIIGLLRYRNGAVQDVTPGKDGVHGFETPIGPLAWVTGDATHLYAITRPFQQFEPTTVANESTSFPVALMSGAFVLQATPFDGNPATGYNVGNMNVGDSLYIGGDIQFHRVFLGMAGIGGGSGNSAGSTLTVKYWNGSAWATLTGVQDYTIGRSSSAVAHSSLYKSGNFVWNTIPPDWVTGGPTGGAGKFWIQLTVAGFDITNFTYIMSVLLGIHQASITMTPAESTQEVAVDHGGTVFVLSGQDAGGVFTWDTTWAFTHPDTTVLSEATVSGGAQPVGYCAVVEPYDINCFITGERYLYVGMEHVSYLCPLGNKPDPTENGPTQQYMPVSTDSVRRNQIIVLPDHDCGIPFHQKTLEDIDFDLDANIAPTDIELFYRVDSGAWTSLGVPTSFPFKLTPGTEPTGTTFGLAFFINGANGRNTRMRRFTSVPRIHVQPRQDMTETVTVEVELQGEKRVKGQQDRRPGLVSYAALNALAVNHPPVKFRDVDSETDEWVHVTSVTKKVSYNSDNTPNITASIVLALTP